MEVKISVVVPAFNEEKLLAGSLQSIKAAAISFQKAGIDHELIVCDNNSSDRTAEIARKEGAAVIFEPHNQIAKARNTGASIATGDWLLFVDADSHPTPELFADLVATIRQGDVIGGGCIVRLDGKRSLLKFLVSWWNLLSRLKKLAAGSFVFCETKAFREIGGFSSTLYATEEIDLSTRLKKLGRRQKKKFVILHKYPLCTSARKADLYTPLEVMRFMARTVFTVGKTLNHKDSCPMWYDGRR